METRRGIPVSAGVAVGVAFLLDNQAALVGRKFLMPEEVPQEIIRFDASLERSRQEIDELGHRLRGKLGGDDRLGDIFLVHQALLADPKLREQVTNLITNRLFTAEYAVHEILRRYGKSLEDAGDSYLLQRVRDFDDIQQRLLRNLAGECPPELADLPGPVVVIARDLTPSQTASFDPVKILAMATEAGGRTSHTAILARALGIPAVVGVTGLLDVAVPGEMIVVDGGQGMVIAGPDEATRRDYEARGRSFEVSEMQTAAEFCNLPAVTRDGRRVSIHANIEFPREVETILQHGAEGVGLYRTEFLYHTAETPPDEAEHFSAYMEAIRALAGHPMTIRVLDLGADKFPAGYPEKNPFLGCRSMRLLRLHPGVFRAQVRAILRASAMGKLRFMFPLICNLDELRDARNLVNDVMAEFDANGTPYDKSIPVGMMIEVPSAAMMADAFSAEVDFFSIGTNDLIQYSLAIDRDNEHVAHLYSPVDPAVLRLMHMTLAAADRSGIDVSICGEMAGDLMCVILMVGMGFRSLSMAPHTIPDTKKLIRSITYDYARQVAQKALTMTTARDIELYLREEMRKVAPEMVREG